MQAGGAGIMHGERSERLLAQIPLIIAEYYRAAKGQPVIAPKPELTVHAAADGRVVRMERTPFGEQAELGQAIDELLRILALAILGAHPAVVAPALDALRPQKVGERVDGLDRRGVDDAAALLLLDQP